MRKIQWRMLALIAILALVMAACGTDDDTATEEPADTGDDATEPAEEGTEEEEVEEVESDGILTIGTILPETGSLAFLGPPEFAGVELAVQEVNEAGGVLGNDIELMQGDSGDTTTDIANQTVDRHLGQNANVIIGAASSAVSFTVIDKITQAGVIMFSPANTSPDFTDYDDNGLYFRTAPSDILQGRVLAETIIDDGNATVGLMALQDPYGEGLLENAVMVLENSGAEVTDQIVYDPQAQNFDAEIQQLASSDPDAIVVIGFDESSRILSTMIEQGLGPEDKMVYGVDGNIGNALGEAVDASLEGMRGTLPGSVATGEFQERLLEIDPDLQDYSYSGESYDAVVVVALAAIAAGTDDGQAVAAEIPGVTRDGTKCTSFEECRDLLEAGEDIDYDGVSGPIEMDENGDPTVANFQILAYGPDNQIDPDLTETREVALE
jgi:ABC-type branched-subunit amino acid transport system substrate-binding protein